MAFASGPFPLVAPHGSYQARFCTNPLAIGIPTDGEPIVLDMATGAIAYFGLIEAKAAGRSIPDNTCYDIAGKVTTSPEDAMKGAIMTFDRSYKGSALAMMVQILAGPLIDVDYFDAKSTNAGNLIIAIDPEILVDGDVFKKNVSDLSAKVKQSTKLKGVDEIFLPGERGDNLTNERLASGEIEVEDNLYQELEKLANAV